MGIEPGQGFEFVKTGVDDVCQAEFLALLKVECLRRLDLAMGQQNFDAMNLWSDCVESIEGDVMLPEELMQLIMSYICPGHKVWLHFCKTGGKL